MLSYVIRLVESLYDPNYERIQLSYQRIVNMILVIGTYFVGRYISSLYSPNPTGRGTGPPHTRTMRFSPLL